MVSCQVPFQMAEEIAFENGKISKFEGLVFLTLTLDRAMLHTVMHHSSTSIYKPNFIEVEETFCGRTDGRTYAHTYAKMCHWQFSTANESVRNRKGCKKQDLASRWHHVYLVKITRRGRFNTTTAEENLVCHSWTSCRQYISTRVNTFNEPVQQYNEIKLPSLTHKTTTFKFHSVDCWLTT